VQQQLGTRFAVAQTLSKPKSPSNLSMVSHEDEDKDDIDDYEQLAVPDEHIIIGSSSSTAQNDLA